MVKTYSKKSSGSSNVSAHFKVGEFASHDGADKILIDFNLVQKLEEARSLYKKPITFNSAYRTPNHNKRVGGVSDSCHIFGKAVDIPYNKSLETILRNVGLYVINEGSWLHCDTRYIAPTGQFPTLTKGNKNWEWNNFLQHCLTRKGYKCIKDGQFGRTTEAQVKVFQRVNGLIPDGICGSRTWSKLNN